MSNIMIDLETMSTRPDAAIVSIGAVRFNGKEILNKLYIGISLKSSVDMLGDLDTSTILWWMNQAPIARDAITNKDNIHIIEGLNLLSSFIDKYDKVWGNGSDFDNVILSNAYSNCAIDLPWKYYNNRCYRTIKSLAPGIKIDREGIHHNALDDALSQTKHLVKICDKLGIEL